MSTSNTIPTSDLVASYTIVDTDSMGEDFLRRDTQLDDRLGQTFLVAGSEPVVIDRVTLRLGTSGYVGSLAADGIVVQFWHFSGPDQAWPEGGNPPGSSPFNTQTGAFAVGSEPATDDYWTFHLDGVTLAPNDYYGFLIGFSATEATGRLLYFAHDWLYVPSGDPSYEQYRDGKGLEYQNSGFFNYARDYEFYVQGSIVPEPGSLGLLAVAAGYALSRRRRRF